MLQAMANKLIVLSDRYDETAQIARYHAPIDHDLESWGDAEPVAGRFLLQQPLLNPLWNSRLATKPDHGTNRQRPWR